MLNSTIMSATLIDTATLRASARTRVHVHTRVHMMRETMYGIRPALVCFQTPAASAQPERRRVDRHSSCKPSIVTRVPLRSGLECPPLALRTTVFALSNSSRVAPSQLRPLRLRTGGGTRGLLDAVHRAELA